jgi:broad specificity phosphatase PhoE
MKNTIYLIRHAEAQSNINPHHVGEACLTEEGILQSQKLAKYLSDKHVSDIYVSEVLRAKLTAHEISKRVNKVPVELSFLKERKGSYSDDVVFLAEESFDEMKIRLIKTKHFLENLSHGHVVVVSHAIFIKALLAYIMTSEVFDERVMFEIGDTLVIDNATVTKLVFNTEKRKWRILGLNFQI